MGSRSSRRRSAGPAAEWLELIRALLRHGARFLSPERERIEAAEWLAGLGIVDLHRASVVRCANATDADFGRGDRDCGGVIELRDGADEGGGDHRCLGCERVICPEADQKQRFDSLLVHLRRAGIEAFLIDRCNELAVGRAFAGGVLAVPVQGMNAAVCLVDYCSDERWLRRGFGANQPCVYVSVGPDVAPRILQEEAIAHVELVDILLGARDLRAILVERATSVPALLRNVDVPIYGLGTNPIAPAPRDQPEPRRVFHIRLSPAGLLVDGLLADRVQRRDTAMAIMRVFMETYAMAAASGRVVEPMTANALANALDPRAEKFEDADSIARHIPRIRKSIVDTVRQHTGQPIGEHDIIETVSRSGADGDAEGYRLNPRSVALGPLEP